MGTELIDLRSDTVTKPGPDMRKAMLQADLGDDVFGEDPTVNKLQEYIANLFGKESALFVPSGTMGNQVCIKVHTKPGDEVIVERDAHVFRYETGGISFLSGVQVNTIIGVRGAFTTQEIVPEVRPDVYYMPKTRLICLENTHNRAGGTIFPIRGIREIRDYGRSNGIALHLDGARIWNAVVATGIPPQEYAECFDSISVCFSKGLGAPVGSAIMGSREFVDEARHYRKIFGGGMRQAGVLAAAAYFAVRHNVERLSEDHEKAKLLARELEGVPGLTIDMESVQTNILIVDVSKSGRTPGEVVSLLQKNNVLLTEGTYTSVRAVTHLDVSQNEVLDAARIIREVLS